VAIADRLVGLGLHIHLRLRPRDLLLGLVCVAGANQRQLAAVDESGDGAPRSGETKIVVVTLAMVALCKWVSGRSWAELGFRRAAAGRIAGGTLGVGVIYFAILYTSDMVSSWGLVVAGVAGREYPGSLSHASTDFVINMAQFASAGPKEELLCVAVPFALANARRWPAWATLLLMLIVRLAFHLYYGWTSTFVLLWVPATYVLYRAARSIWPLVIAHSLYDLAIGVLARYHGRSHELLAGIRQFAVYLGIALIAVSIDRYRRRPRHPAPSLDEPVPLWTVG
jgi:hypothetical protein